MCGEKIAHPAERNTPDMVEIAYTCVIKRDTNMLTGNRGGVKMLETVVNKLNQRCFQCAWM